jgi:predicted nucleic acid-binding protein
VIIDTMVFAYALLGVPGFKEDAVAVLAGADEIQGPDSLRAELANVCWQWVRHRDLPLEVAIDVLHDADALISHTFPGEHLWERALELAVDADHPAYDAMFVAAAEIAGTRVVTFDQDLKRAFTDRVITAGEFLSRPPAGAH